MNTERKDVVLVNPEDFSERKTFRVKEKIIIPPTRWAAEKKSVLLLEEGQSEHSLYTRKIEQNRDVWALPTLIGFDLEGKSLADIYYLAWKVLKERSFLVVPKVWVIADDVVATTCLIEDQITSIYDPKIDSDPDGRDTQEMDKEFIKIPGKDIKKKADALVSLANKAGVVVMSDGAFHIIVRPDTSWQTEFLDIGKVRIYARQGDLSEADKYDNRRYADWTVRKFCQAQVNILGRREAWKLT